MAVSLLVAGCKAEKTLCGHACVGMAMCHPCAPLAVPTYPLPVMGVASVMMHSPVVVAVDDDPTEEIRAHARSQGARMCLPTVAVVGSARELLGL